MSEVDSEATTKPRRRQQEAGNYFQTLLNSLTLEQIREATFGLAPLRRIQLRKHADAEEALLKTACDQATVIKALLEVEARHPFKHCLLLRLAERATIPESSLGNLFQRGGIEFRLVFASDSPTQSLTFEHSVEFKEWVEIAKDTRQRKTVVTRQPIVVRILPKQSLITINYPGFTHSVTSGNPDGGYEKVVESLLAVLQRDLGIGLRTLPVKNTLGVFMEGPNRRVLRVKADVDSPLARLDVSSKNQDGTIEEALGAFLTAHLPGVAKAQVIEAAKRAFNEASLNSIVLFWLQESLFTRLKFWDIGTELFFIWNKENPTYRVVDSVATLLASTADLAASQSPSKPLEWLARLAPNSMVTPAELAATHSLEPASARDFLIRAMASGLVEPVYRVKTNQLILETPNPWSADLGTFKRLLTTESGGTIDGSDPENIEVAFQRIGTTQARETN